MFNYFHKILTRNQLKSEKEVIIWWGRGRALITLVFIFCVLIHFSIYVFVYKNGFVFFLLPFIALLFLAMHIFYSVGLYFEIIAKYYFKSKRDFDKISPKIKIAQFVVIGLTLYALCIWDLYTSK